MDDKQLRLAGLKVTSARLKILQLLERAEAHHMSAEDIYRALLEEGEEAGLATVYRALAQFEQAGLVKRHNFEGGYSVFELDQGEHHDHLVCVKCGKVVEFVDKEIEARQTEIAKKQGFIVTDHQHNIYGLCPNCK